MKIEINEYTPAVAMKHIGAMLIALAADAQGRLDEQERRGDTELPTDRTVLVDKDACCAGPSEEELERQKRNAYATMKDTFSPTVTPPPVPTGLPVTTPGALDADGIPWDNRIHTAAKTQCKDGTWKLRPGVDKDLVAQVKAQLQGVQALPVPAPPVEAAPTIPAPPVADPAAALFAPPPPAATVAAPVASQGAPAPATFAELIKALTPRLTAGTLTADQVNAACQTVGLATCNLLAARQDLIPAVWSQLQ